MLLGSQKLLNVKNKKEKKRREDQGPKITTRIMTV
jgi:hypothetical protein